MDLLVYSIYDQVAGAYGELFLAINDGVAQRRFNDAMVHAPLVANDCKLFRLGKYDSLTGAIEPLKNPEFICNYEVINE